MAMAFSPIPEKAYGILLRDTPGSKLEDVAEQVRHLGYAIFDSGFSASELTQLASAFNSARANYIQRWGEACLRSLALRPVLYQHYVSSSPLAVKALFCVDDFTHENGSTFVLPASH